MTMTRLQRFLIFVFLLVGCGSSKERVEGPQPQPSANASASAASAEPSASAAPVASATQTTPPPAVAWKPFLYKVGGAKPSYLFGTIHVPDDRLAMPAQSLKDAFHDAEEVVTELPLDDTSPAHAMQLAGMPAGKSLPTELPKPVYERLKKVLTDKGLGMAMPMMDHMKVWAVAIQIGLLDHLQELMGGKKPIDVVLHDRAKELGKKTSGLETEAEQLSVFDTLSKDEQSRFLEEALDERDADLAAHKDSFSALMNLYLAGDEAPLLTQLNQGFDMKKPLDQKIMKRLITDRNKVMTDRIAAKLKASPGHTYLFAVGSAHLLGDDGIVSQLKKKGLTVDRVQ
ncbi:MAG TPA: TraB/GumN family protein [Polyangiaceae bacterium]|jgi:hypothetical protein|nr:TraB/GumN family protein [Polyangiaceae bacterium]